MLVVKDQTKQKNKTTAKIVLLIIGIILVLITVSVAVFGRYIFTKVQKTKMNAAGFYISSDYLAFNGMEGISKKKVPVSGWNNGINFELYNYEVQSDNTKKVTKIDVIYTYSLDESSSLNWEINSIDDGTKVTNTNNEVEITQQVKLTLKEDHNAKKGDEIKVTVTTAPYEAKFEVIFTLTDEILPDYKIVDKGLYELVTINSNNYSGTIKITWDKTIRVPDVTNDLMESFSDGTGIITVEKFKTYELIFFEEIEDEYLELNGTGTSVSVD